MRCGYATNQSAVVLVCYKAQLLCESDRDQVAAPAGRVRYSRPSDSSPGSSLLQSDHKLFHGPDLSDCCDVQCSAAEDAGRGAVGAAAARRLGGGAQADAVGVPPRPAGHPLRDLRDVVER